MPETSDQLVLSVGLTAKAKALCHGLESGAAEILDLVTPTTAELLKWWFGDDMVAARGWKNRRTPRQPLFAGQYGRARAVLAAVDKKALRHIRQYSESGRQIAG